MLKDSKKAFSNYMMEKGYTVNSIAVAEGVYKKMSSWEITKNKKIIEMSKNELIDLCQEGKDKIANKSYYSMNVRVKAINDILKWLQMDITLSMRDFDIEEVLACPDDRFFTKEEMQDVCDLFINPQDKFIIYALFCGIYGKGYSDLLNLKVKDIDIENKIITTPSGRIIHMDNYLLDVAKDTIDPTWGATYYKYIPSENKGSTTDTYDLNMSSEYVLKAKPYSKNNNGLDAMKVNGIQRRLIKLSELSDFNLSGTDILRSGMMHNMHLEELETGKEWTCASLEIWLKENGLKAQPFELYRLYKNKYKKEQSF